MSLASPPNPKRVTTRTIQEMKDADIPIACLTAYDFLMARTLDNVGIDIILVGDSVSNVFQGNNTTLPVTLEEMIYHTKAVSNIVDRAMVVTDLPFMSYQVTVEEAFRNAGKIMKETRSGGVKVEGGKRVAKVVEKISGEGIPTMGHVGLLPQSILKYGGYQPRGRTEEEAQEIIEDAIALEEAGAFAVVIEKVPADLGKRITEALTIPTIGIGAGPDCSGQILVTHDMLGLYEDFQPRFVRKYATLNDEISKAVSQYIEDIKNRSFPNESESY
ncbi:MAG: 3-methyl-2-oxobutanoate hydroxymethyltransferase [Ectothiorhodospiraceae bacterium]|nr:3-methyl-2-oxobutanoate hydroxymethyltransferase [Ectothiorhodospiraceae bacterium]